MSERDRDIAQTEVAVLMRRKQRPGQEAVMARESIFAPESRLTADANLAQVIGQRIAEAPGYSMVFMRRLIPFGAPRDAFIREVERASRMQAGVGFALVFPLTD